MTNSKNQTVLLTELAQIDVEDVGNKAYNLVRLRQMGFEVPPAFCVLAAAYRQHLEAILGNSDFAMISQAQAFSTDVQNELAQLRQNFLEHSMDSQLEASIKECWQTLRGMDPSLRVAVRSSATAEDSGGSSFAGQYETYLGIETPEHCVDAVKQCWASLWSDRAYSYRQRQGIVHLDINMSVVVQQLVIPDASGVLFCFNPVTGETNQIIIEACFGFGEALVSGKVTPDRYVVNKETLKEQQREVANKRISLVLRSAEQGGPERGRENNILEKNLDTDKARQACLRPQQVEQLSRLAQQAERSYGFPLDMEWAIVGETLYFLQARPITTLPQVAVSSPPALSEKPYDDPSNQVWTNINAGEVIPDVVTPMTWCFVEPIANKLLGNFFLKVGLFSQRSLFGLVAGRVFFNLNATVAVTAKLRMGGNGIDPEMFGGGPQAKELFDVRIPPEHLPPVTFRLGTLLRQLPGFLWQLFFMSQQQAEERCQELRDRANDVLDFDAQHETAETICERIESIGDFLHNANSAFDLMGVALACQTNFFNKCAAWFGDEGRALGGQLLSGLGGTETANAGLELWELSRLARKNESLKKHLLACQSFEQLRRQLVSIAGGSDFLSRFETFMKTHGHHARAELELSNPRWAEKPEEIVAQICGYMESTSNGDFIKNTIS